MRFIVAAVALVATYPLSLWIRDNRWALPKIWMLIGMAPLGLTALLPWFTVTPISWEFWFGFVKGFQITILDVIVLAVYFTLPRSRVPLPFRGAMALYFAAVVLSVFQSSAWMASAFYVWQLVRVYLVYVVVARACVDEEIRSALLLGLAIGLVIQIGLAGWQRVAHGIVQASGSLGHQNALGFATHFATFPLFALLLAGTRRWHVIVGPIAGALIVVLTASRATLGFAGAGLALLFVISASRRWTSRKAKVAMVGTLALSILAPIAVISLQQRFATEQDVGGYDERAAFERAASMVLSDYPLGVGVNTYVTIANAGGYMERAGVTWGGQSRTTYVHNAYWATAAETGYFGVIAFAFLILRIMFVAFHCGLRARNDPRGDLLLGLGVCLLVVALHNFYEWIFFLFTSQYLFAMAAGMVASLAQQLGYWRSGNKAMQVGIKGRALENRAG